MFYSYSTSTRNTNLLNNNAALYCLQHDRHQSCSASTLARPKTANVCRMVYWVWRIKNVILISIFLLKFIICFQNTLFLVGITWSETPIRLLENLSSIGSLLYDLMKIKQAQFKSNKTDENIESLKADGLASNLSSHDFKNFWKGINKSSK